MRARSRFEPRRIKIRESVSSNVWWRNLSLKDKIKYLHRSLIGRPRWVVWYPYGKRYLSAKNGKVTLVKNPHQIDKSMQRTGKNGIETLITNRAKAWRKQLCMN